MQSTWVVVADRDRATIYAVPRGMARLRQVCELRPPCTSMNADPGPPVDAGVRDSQRTLGTPEERACGFAVQVAAHLEDGCRERRFDELILAAAPPFLACLRENLSQAVRDAVVAEIGRDLVGAQQELLQEQVLRVL